MAPNHIEALEQALRRNNKTAGRPDEPCGIVRVVDASKNFVAWAQYNSVSKIRSEYSHGTKNGFPIPKGHEEKNIQAFSRRKLFSGQEYNLYSVIFSEADDLPGLIVDRLGDILVVQFLTGEMDSRREEIAESIIKAAEKFIPEPFIFKALYERSDGDGRRLEGLPERRGVLRGSFNGGNIEIMENGYRMEVDPSSQKTGFFCDSG
jgi:23S rRNA (cytosine1962-C5)-methyltransferase